MTHVTRKNHATSYFNDILKFSNEVCTQEQLKISVLDFIRRSKLKSKIDINYCTNREDKYQGFSFVWFENKKIYNILLGNDYDGTERVKKENNPKGDEKEKEYLRLSGSSTTTETSFWDSSDGNGNGNTLSWADDADLCDELDEKYGSDVIKVKLEPLVKLPQFRLTREQKLKLGYQKNYSNFTISSVSIRYPDPKTRISHILFAQRVCISSKVLAKKLRALTESEIKIKEIFRGSNRCLQIFFNRNNKTATISFFGRK